MCVCVYVYHALVYIIIYISVCLYIALYKSDSWDILGRSYDKDEMTHKQYSWIIGLKMRYTPKKTVPFE